MLIKKNRMVSQDIAKGIAILMVVLLHIIEVPTIIRVVVGLLFGYAMPFFLFMSGYNYKNRGLTPWQNIKNRIGKIIKPFIIYTLAIAIVMSFHYVLNNEASIQECIKSYLGFLVSRWGTSYLGWDLPKTLFQRIFGPLWFIQYLVPSSIIFYLFVDKALKDTKSFIITVFLLATSSVILIQMGLVLPWGIQDAPAIAGIMIVGSWCHQNNKLFNEPSDKKWKYINCLVCIVVISVIELTGNTAGYIAAGEMSAVFGSLEVYVTFLIAILGSYLIINISKALEKHEMASNIFVWLGQHSLQILILHLPIAHLVIDFFGYKQMITEFPVAVDRISIDQIITFIVTATIMYLIILLLEKPNRAEQ